MSRGAPTVPPEAGRGIALISGCSSGFGLLTAIEMARQGFRVVATMRNLEKRAALDTAAREAGVSLDVDRLDVTDPDSIRAAVGAVLDRHGRIDVLVNNAGFAMAGFAEDVSLTELRAQMETNFFGAVALTKAVLPGMRARRHGRVITVSSVAGRYGIEGMSAYNASKWAVEGWFEALRYEALPCGVHVSLIEPGYYPTEIFSANRTTARATADPSAPSYRRSRRLMDEVAAQFAASRADPGDVARLIARVARARRPHLRYPAGRSARFLVGVAPLLPPAWMDRIRQAIARRRNGPAEPE